ncbi:hypothetical protein FRC03_012667 [Tulasnella sp. 419]|nr:hypothetical protein FRC03_012667 [Tulasnella sp. 419]
MASTLKIICTRTNVSTDSPSTLQAPEKITQFRPFVDSRTTHSKFYLPTDFNRKNRIDDPDAPRTFGRPSGLGPSAERTKSTDPFLALDINLKQEFRNGTLLSQFTTNMGLIKNRGETKLSRGNQRKLAKAVKRARNMGLLPYFSNNVTNLQ